MSNWIRNQLYFLSSLTAGKKIPISKEEEIDVVIPVIGKDLLVLPLCIEGVRRQVNEKINTIYIVAPNDQLIRDCCEKLKVTFVDENSILGYSVHDIDFKVKGQGRGGWIFQQLLKLSNKVGTCDNFLVIDADHVLVKPHTFINVDGRTVFYRSKEYHNPYYSIIRKLFGRCRIPALSYVDHKMLFNRAKLNELHRILEERSHLTWDCAILEALDREELSSFSEYETYGTFVRSSDKLLLPWRNKNLIYEQMDDYDKLCVRYSGRYRCVTFPEYRKE